MDKACLLYTSYNLNQYNRIVNQRNKLLKDIWNNSSMRDILSVWDEQLADFGEKIIERRVLFAQQLNDIIAGIHHKLSGGREHLSIVYEPDTAPGELADKIVRCQDRDIRLKMTSAGPHRDEDVYKRQIIDCFCRKSLELHAYPSYFLLFFSL